MRFRTLALVLGVCAGSTIARADFCSDLAAINSAATSNFSKMRGAAKSSAFGKTFVATVQPAGAQDCDVMLLQGGGIFYSCWWPLSSPNKREAVDALANRTAKCLGVKLEHSSLGNASSAMQTVKTRSAEFEYRSEYNDKMISMMVSKKQ